MVKKPGAVLEAHAVATPALGRVSTGCRSGRLLGATAGAAHVDLDGFVATVSRGSLPLLPNAVAVGAGWVDWPARGSCVGFGGDGTSATLLIRWDETRPPAWDPALPTRLPAVALAERGRGILAIRGIEPVADAARLAQAFATSGVTIAETADGRAAVELLLGAVHARDPEAGAAAASLLLGRGPGLTPQGDDLLAATAAVLAAAAPAETALLRAVVPFDARAWTTALSATLLELASTRCVGEALWGTLDLAAPDEEWRASLRRLGRLGATTGAAYAAAAGAVALLLSE